MLLSHFREKVLFAKLAIKASILHLNTKGHIPDLDGVLG